LIYPLSDALSRSGLALTSFAAPFFLFCHRLPAFIEGPGSQRGRLAIPDLRNLIPYSITIKSSDGVEKMVERFSTVTGGHVARISGNGRVYAYAVDQNQEPPMDYLILDPDGSERFIHKYGPDDFFQSLIGFLISLIHTGEAPRGARSGNNLFL